MATPNKDTITKRKPNFVLSKSAKIMLAGVASKLERNVLKSLLIDAESTYENSEWVTMQYEVSANGKRQSKPRKD